jgi:hypothetical protein
MEVIMRYDVDFEAEPFQGYTDFDELEGDTESELWLPPWIDKVFPKSAMPPPPTPPPAWVRALLPQLNNNRGLPLDLLIGWIATESGGNIASTTNLDERGFFQLGVGESKTLGLDHKRLSTDAAFSIQAGIKLADFYARHTETRLRLQRGTDLFWRVVRLMHASGMGDATNLIEHMTKQGSAPATWDDVRKYAAANGAKLVGAGVLKLHPTRFIAQVDETFDLGTKFVKQHQDFQQYQQYQKQQQQQTQQQDQRARQQIE